MTAAALSTQTTFKIVLLGEASVGKSALVLRFTRNIFLDAIEATIGAAFTPHTFTIDGSTLVKAEIWDTAGQERFASLAPMYYRGASAALVAFDQTTASSFERAVEWVRQLKENGPANILIALLANKSDLTNKEVDIDAATTYAAFQTIVKELMKRNQNRPDISPPRHPITVGQGSENTNFKVEETTSTDDVGSFFSKCCWSG